MEKHLKVSKMYLETHRDKLLVESDTLQKAKGFFEERGIRTAGGITLTVDERNRFETFCYSDPAHRSWVQKVVEHTARHFDEIILDDFYFTSCKSEVEIRARESGAGPTTAWPCSTKRPAISSWRRRGRSTRTSR